MPAAAVPAIVSGASGLITAGTGLAQSISAGKRARDYQRMIDNYRRQTLTNPYAGLQVSTMGADRQREDLARTMSTFADNAAMGGSRAIVGLAPNAIQQQMEQEAKIMANLDEQFKQNQRLQAEGNNIVQQMQENRENNDLAGLGQALQTARQERANGINTFAQGMMGLGMSAASGMFNGLGGLDKVPSSLGVGKTMGIVQNGNTLAELTSGKINNTNPLSFLSR